MTDELRESAMSQMAERKPLQPKDILDDLETGSRVEDLRIIKKQEGKNEG